MAQEKNTQQPHVRDNIKSWEEPLFNDLRRIFSEKRLREVLTHSSFYEQEGKGNSRMAFAGMFVFKGQVGELLYKYISGDGTRLQHILGNLFRQERLMRLYDEWKLQQFVRAGDSFDINSHKHVFVYALLGYVSTLDEDIRNWFISKYILNEEANHLLTHQRKNRNLLAQADDIVRQTDGRRLTIEMEQTEEGLHKAKVMLSDGTLLCEAESKSWRYARQKASKTALNILATPLRKLILSNAKYHERIAAKIEAEREKRREEIEARDAEKEAIRKQKREERKVIARIRDAKRRQSQAEAKKRKQENAERAAAKAAKEARPISAKKRRFLEDKKK